MNRFLVFAFGHHPEGGWNDYIGSADSLLAARLLAPEGTWWHVVDATAGDIIDAGYQTTEV